VQYGDFAWRTGRVYLGWPMRAMGRVRAYGTERVPPEGGIVLAANHMHWADIPVLGVVCPRNVNYVAKLEVLRFPLLGSYVRWFGTISVRRGASDRDAVRLMRQAVRDGRALGLFVEGTRLKLGRPGPALPGAAMVALQEEVPVVPTVIYGTQFWKIGNFKPCSVAFGEPLYFEGLTKTGRGYKEATAEIERRINVLFDWLAELHANGRPKRATPPL
jgi:1-acyl-sn-glycerol-3-phosphate acyltransferase